MTVALPQSLFDRIAEIAKANWGLNLTEKKKQLVTNRLTSFVRKSHFNSIDEYVAHLEVEADDEDRLVFFDILSTNVTSFFRESAHFDCLERELYTPLNKGNITLPGKKIRMWSAACSTGPEPYTMAIHACEHFKAIDSWDFKILATDLSNSAVRQAMEGIYPAKMLEKVDKTLVKKYFNRITDGGETKYEVTQEIRKLVTIGRLNLMDPWPIKGPFDVIFCRNVMIYFDSQTREDLVVRFHELLRPGGFLAIGSAETLTGLSTKFRTLQPSVYVK